MHLTDLQHITDKRFAALQLHWPGMFELNEDSIHDWRVEIKKLRALIRLFKKFEKKIALPESWKKVYDISGEVRDRQVHLHLIKNLFDDPALYPTTYAGFVEEELNHHGQKLRSKTSNDVILHMYYQSVTTQIPEKIPISKLQEYIFQLMIEVRNILWLTYKKDDYLHECRKYLKDAQYLLNIFDLQIALHPIANIPSFEKIEEAGKALGEFQDQCVALGFFSASYLNRLPTKEKELLKHARSVLLKEKNKTKAEVLANFEVLFQDLLHLHTS